MTAAWILQGLLAMVFLGAGTLKLIKTREELVSTGAAGSMGPSLSTSSWGQWPWRWSHSTCQPPDRRWRPTET